MISRKTAISGRHSSALSRELATDLYRVSTLLLLSVCVVHLDSSLL